MHTLLLSVIVFMADGINSKDFLASSMEVHNLNEGTFLVFNCPNQVTVRIPNEDVQSLQVIPVFQ